MRSRTCQQVLLFIFLAVNTELLCQNLLYASALESPNAVWRLDPVVGRRPTGMFSASQRLNRHGLKTVEPPATFPADELRIMCFGSSVTFGWPNNEADSYPVLLEGMLAREVPYVRVFNAGWPSFTTCEMTALLVALEPLYKPQIITLMCGANDMPKDVGGTGVQPYRVIQPDAAKAVFTSPGSIDRVRAVLYRSATYRYLSYLLRGWTPHPTADMQPVYGKSEAETASLTMSVDNLKIFAEYCRQKGIRLLLIGEASRQKRIDAATDPLGIMRIAYAAFAERAGVVYLDMQTAFERSGLAEEELYQPRDVLHLNPAGNRLVAKVIAERLNALGWLRVVQKSGAPGLPSAFSR